jgi:hypothetical protein
MFACLVAGRLAQTNYVQPAPDKIAFQLDNATGKCSNKFRKNN